MSQPHENLTRQEAERRAALLTDLRYDVTLDVTDTEHFRVASHITFRCTEPGADTFVDVTAPRIEGAHLNGEAVDLDGFEGTRLALRGLQEHNDLIIEADHRYSNEGRGLHSFVDPVDGQRYLYTQAEPNDAHLIYACFDQPDLKATFTFQVTVPTDWVVVSNARVDGQPETGADGAVWHFERTLTMSPYITAIVAGPYHVVRDAHGDIDLALYCRQTLAEHLDPDEILELTKQGLDFFPKAFGHPYPWGKYDQVFVPEFAAGAMENAACVTFHENYIFRSKVTDAARLSRAETILHEMAHMWFGDLVTMRWWDDLWLNESFATYTSFYAMEKATRFTNAWVNFNDELKTWATYQDQLPTTHPIEAHLPDVESVHQNFDGITYAKGASVLRQLAAWVGEDAFFDGCARYFADHAYGNATLTDFLGALEDASGRELSAWARTWLQTAGVNTIGVESELDAAGERYASVVVRQDAPEEHPTLRPHRLQVGLFQLTDDGLQRYRSAELDVTGERTEVSELVGAPVADLVLPNDGDLAYTKLALDDRSLRTLTTHLHALDDPLARTLCWTAAWNMVRDGELAARRYVDIVHGNASGESDIGVLQTLLRRARTATELYGDPGHRREATMQMHLHARKALDAAAPGSDPQLAWARHWAATIVSEGDASEVRAVLDGEFGFEGLDVDTDLRWHLIGSLVRADAVGDEVVATQLEADPTDRGQRHAAAVRASRPDPTAKGDAWDAVVEDTSLSHSLADAIMGGLRQYDQPELLDPYVAPYFELLPRIWEERSTDRAITLTQRLYPLPVVTQDLVARTDRAIDSGKLHPAAERELREQRDTVVRALRAREIDHAEGLTLTGRVAPNDASRSVPGAS